MPRAGQVQARLQQLKHPLTPPAGTTTSSILHACSKAAQRREGDVVIPHPLTDAPLTHPVATAPSPVLQWREGDFIMSDNAALGHEASPETQLPPSQVGSPVPSCTRAGWRVG